jgi:hypothetical protein
LTLSTLSTLSTGVKSLQRLHRLRGWATPPWRLKSRLGACGHQTPSTRGSQPPQARQAFAPVASAAPTQVGSPRRRTWWPQAPSRGFNRLRGEAGTPRPPLTQAGRFPAPTWLLPRRAFGPRSAPTPWFLHFPCNPASHPLNSKGTKQSNPPSMSRATGVNHRMIGSIPGSTNLCSASPTPRRSAMRLAPGEKRAFPFNLLTARSSWLVPRSLPSWRKTIVLYT